MTTPTDADVARATELIGKTLHGLMFEGDNGAWRKLQEAIAAALADVREETRAEASPLVRALELLADEGRKDYVADEARIDRKMVSSIARTALASYRKSIEERQKR